MPKVRRRRQQQAKWGFLRTKQTTAILVHVLVRSPKENHQDTTHTRARTNTHTLTHALTHIVVLLYDSLCRIALSTVAM